MRMIRRIATTGNIIYILGVLFAFAFIIALLLWSFPVKAEETYVIGGKSVSCPGHKLVFGRLSGHNIGLDSDNGKLVMDPSILKEKPVVQLFVFHHECGHTYVGRSEYDADCWATQQGVINEWMKQSDIPHICMSFAGPETTTHPAGANRCAHIHHCYFEAYEHRWR